MRSARLFAALFLVASAALPACSSSMFPGAEDGPDGAAESAACATVFDAYIAFNDRCSVSAHHAFDLADGPDPTAKPNFQAACAALAKRSGNGRTVAFWQACERTLRDATCEDTEAVRRACAGAHGGRADGASCASDDECSSGSCSAERHKAPGVESIACGVCRPVSRAGESCEKAPCEEGAVCNTRENICVTLGSRAEYTYCTNDSECAEGLHCGWVGEPSEYKPSVCLTGSRSSYAATTTGDACNAKHVCGGYFTCVDGACAPARAAAGASCDAASCGAGYACKSTGAGGRCAPAVGLGEDCSDHPCAAFLVCSSVDKKCALPVQTCKG